jgi:succinate dehydrogenase/fumarate reductase flavoprotein subunit
MANRDDDLESHERFVYMMGITEQVQATIALALDLLDVAQEEPPAAMRDRLRRIINHSECWRRHTHLAEALEQLVELQKRLDSEMLIGFSVAAELKSAIVLAQRGEQLLELKGFDPAGPAH